jgi:WD40 repeat protein/transcriptional regulator with XRE-family HTH domain
MLRLRGRTGLTQRDIAGRLDVHVHSVQLWEASASHPNARRLQALLEIFLESDAFSADFELEEAEALWNAAVNESPRLNTSFDTAWFARLVRARAASRAPIRRQAAELGSGRQSWGSAPDVERFLSRVEERATLRRWVLEDGCRVVGVLGIGGIGKTLLTARVARDVEPSFQHVYWRSLQNAPTFSDWLAGAIGLLSPRDPALSADDAQRFDRLLELVRETPSLFVIDNVETVLRPGAHTGEYLPGYAAYGELLRQLAETPHASCLLLTGREEPPELAPLKGAAGPVRTLTLAGLATEDVRGLLRDKNLVGDQTAWSELVDYYGGNSLALKVIGETIRELFGGDIAAFLADVAGTHGAMFGGVRHLLDAQVRRLSDVEQRVLRWMALARVGVTFAELAADVGGAVSARGPMREATAALLRRTLVERREPGPTFVLQPVILEYVTEQLVADICHEIAEGPLTLLRQQPLLKATARDLVRMSQERLIVEPVIERLTTLLGSAGAVEHRLVTLLDDWRALPREQQLYGPGNVVNLLRHVRGHLRGIDLATLLIRQAYLPGVEAQDASLHEAHLVESVLPEAFHNMSVCLSADGAHLLTGTTTGEVCLWRASDRALLLSMRGHAGAVWRVTLSSDGRMVVSASEDGTARLWEASTGQLLAILEGHADFVQGVAVADRADLVATASQDGTIKVWRAPHGELVQSLESPDGGVLSVDLSRDGATVIGGTRAGTILFWDAGNGRLARRLAAHTGPIPGLSLNANGRLLASASLDGTAKLWDVRGASPPVELTGHTGGLWNVKMAREGGVVATAGQDGTVRLWSTATGQPLSTWAGHQGAVWDVSLSADGQRAASAGQDGTVLVSESRTGHLLTTLRGHTSAIRDVALSADGRWLASGSQDGTVTVWNTASGEPRARFHGHQANVSGVALTDDGSLAASASQDGTVKLWDVDSAQLRCTLSGHTGTVWDVDLSADGTLAASGSFDGTVRLWDTRRRVAQAILRGHTQGVRGVALNDARCLVVSGSQDGSLMLWSTADGSLRATLRGHSDSVQSVAMDRAGLRIASAGFDGAVRLWDATTGICLHTLPAHTGGVLCVALSRDGRLLVTGGFDRAVKIWNAENGRLLETLTGQSGAIWGVSLNADATLLASGSFDGTVRLWDVPRAVCQRTLHVDRPFERVDISGLTGITAANRAALMALGALERRPDSLFSWDRLG